MVDDQTKNLTQSKEKRVSAKVSENCATPQNFTLQIVRFFLTRHTELVATFTISTC